jgi:hypothetical protein
VADSPTNFAALHAPMLWAALLPEFGRTVQYYSDVDPPIAITVIWREGVEGEPISPGSYSNILVQVADLPRPPSTRDMVESEAGMFEVWTADASAYGYSRCVLKAQPASETRKERERWRISR